MSQTKMAQINMSLGTVLKSWRKSSLRRGLVALSVVGGAIAAVAAPANIGLVGGKTGDFETTAPLRHPDRCRERHRPVREERRHADAALQHGQADDRRGRVQRDQAGPHQARRRVHRSARTPGARAARRRTPRACSLPIHSKVAGRGPAARRHHPVRQRRLHRARRRHRRQRARIRRDDDQAGARARPAPSRSSPIRPACRTPRSR